MTGEDRDRELMAQIVSRIQYDGNRVLPPIGPMPGPASSAWLSLPNNVFYEHAIRLHRESALRELREQFPTGTVIDPAGLEAINVQARTEQTRLIDALVQANREERFT